MKIRSRKPFIDGCYVVHRHGFSRGTQKHGRCCEHRGCWLGESRSGRVPPCKQLSHVETSSAKGEAYTPTLGTTHRNLLLHNRLYWVDTRPVSECYRRERQHKHLIQTDHTQLIQIMTTNKSENATYYYLFKA